MIKYVIFQIYMLSLPFKRITVQRSPYGYCEDTPENFTIANKYKLSSFRPGESKINSNKTNTEPAQTQNISHRKILYFIAVYKCIWESNSVLRQTNAISLARGLLNSSALSSNAWESSSFRMLYSKSTTEYNVPYHNQNSQTEPGKLDLILSVPECPG